MDSHVKVEYVEVENEPAYEYINEYDEEDTEAVYVLCEEEQQNEGECLFFFRFHFDCNVTFVIFFIVLQKMCYIWRRL